MCIVRAFPAMRAGHLIPYMRFEPHRLILKYDDMLGYVYSPYPNGHRQQYVDLFANITQLRPEIKPLTLTVFFRLLKARSLALVTFDDRMISYTVLVIMRAFLAQRTVGLSLRADSCFSPPPVKAWVKRVWFKALKKLPCFTLLTPVPYAWKPEFQNISNDWIYDPQFWDLYFTQGRSLSEGGDTDLSKQILDIADGRPVLTYVGSLSQDKGFEFFKDIAQFRTSQNDDFLCVAAGQILSGLESVADDFKRAGGILIDRFVSDKELESLYNVSDLIWACYTPFYDQTSGVFGRAIQKNVPTCVRERSLVADIAHNVSLDHVALPYGRPDQAVERITNSLKSSELLHERQLKTPNFELLEGWMMHSMSVIQKALGLVSEDAQDTHTNVAK